MNAKILNLMMKNVVKIVMDVKNVVQNVTFADAKIIIVMIQMMIVKN